MAQPNPWDAVSVPAEGAPPAGQRPAPRLIVPAAPVATPQTAEQAAASMSQVRRDDAAIGATMTPEERARRNALEAQKLELETAALQSAQQRGGMTSEQLAGYRDRYQGLGAFEQSINEIERLYGENYRGGMNRNLSGYLPEWISDANQEFNAAGGRLVDAIATVYGISGTELNSLAELRARLGPYLPVAGDTDSTIEGKLNALRGILQGQRQYLERLLPENARAAANPFGDGGEDRLQGIPPVGSPPPSAGGQQQSDAPLIAPTGAAPQEEARRYEGRWEPTGQNDPNRAGLNAELASIFRRGGDESEYRAAMARRGMSPEQIEGSMVDIRTAEGWAARNRGRRNDVGFDMEREVRWNPGVDISRYRSNDPTAMQAISQRIDSTARGITDTALLGLPDELAGLIGGEEAMERERAIAEFDEDNQPGTRVAGQVFGGAALPMGRVSTPGQAARVGAAYGGAYGGGSAEGSLADRLGPAAAGAAIGGVVGGAAQWGLDRLVARAARPGGRVDRAQVRQDAQALGVDLGRRDTGGVGTRMAGAIVERTPGGIPMAAAAERSVQQAGAARDRIAGTIGQVGADTAAGGQAAQRGARAFLGESEARASQLYDRVPIADTASANTSNTVGALRELNEGMASNEVLSEMFENSTLQGYQRALEGIEEATPTGILDASGNSITRQTLRGGGLSWRDMKDFRSRIGEMIGQPRVSGDDVAGSQLRRLYAALSDDMEATAAAAGPRALTAVRRAAQYWRGREARREGVLSDILGPDGLRGDQQAFQQINAWAQNTNGNWRRTAQALRSMPPDDANAVRATILGQMGRANRSHQDATGELFSPATFATQWAGMSSRAKSVLFPDRQHRAAIDQLVRVTSTMQRARTEFRNFSNTGLAVNGVALVSGLQSAPISTLAAAGGSYLLGKFLASPTGSGWLRSMTRTANPQAAIRGLAAVARRDPAIAQEALGLRDILLRAANDNLDAPARQMVASQPGQGQNEQDER